MYILVGIIFFTIFLLFCPMYIYVFFEDSLLVKIRILFFKFTLFPRKKYKNLTDQKIEPEKKDEKIINEGKKSKILDIIKEKGPIVFLKILKAVIDTVLNSAKKFLNCLYIDSLQLNYVVVGDNAADTAIKYGKVYALIASAMSIFFKITNKKKCSIKILPGFNERESRVKFVCRFHFIPIKITIILISMISKLIKSLYEDKIRVKIRKDAVK